MKTARKKKHSDAELHNDPSLRFCGYHMGEGIWSDTHKTVLRFNGYNSKGCVLLASIDAIAPIKGSVDPLSVRRVTVQESYQ